MRGQRHAPAALYLGKRTSTHCTGDWVGPRAGLDKCGKSRPPPGFDPRTVQLVASRYTEYATRPTVNFMPPRIFGECARRDKFLSVAGFEPQTTQHVASSCTNCLYIK